MANGQNKKNFNSIIGLLTNRVHFRQQQTRVSGPEGYRTIDNLIDDSGVGSNNETENIIIDDRYVLDCGHPARDNFGGRSHCCDSLLCESCVHICSCCGHALCNFHYVTKNFDGREKEYCETCAEEIQHSLGLRAFGFGVLSFFIKRNKDR